MRPKAALTLVLLTLVAAGHAQTQTPDDPIWAIRPRITDTTRLVPLGRFQVEAGVDYGYGGFDILRRNDYGTVLRYGAGQRVEVRVEAPTYTVFRNIRYNDGFGNTSVSAVALLGRSGPLWFTVQPRLTFPTATRLRRADEVAPSIFFTGEAEVADSWLLASTVGGLHQEYGGESYDVLRATFAVERYLDARASAFAEYVGTYLRGSTPGHLANLGARLRLDQRSQIDAHWSLPISDTVSPRGLGAGYSVRF